MKKLYVIGVLLLLLASIVSSAAAAASDTTSLTSTTSSQSTTSSSADYVNSASLISVSNVTMNPQTFYPGESGIISVTLTNTGTQAIGLSNPEILSNSIKVTNPDPWNTMTYISPGLSTKYSLNVQADANTGTFYPTFTIGTKDGGSVHAQLPIKIESTDISATISQKPDAFGQAKEDNVTLSIINPREGAISNVIVTVEGSGLSSTPSQKYVGAVAAESSVDVPFSITPTQESPVTFHISYNNGDNVHTQDVTMPVTFGVDKTSAVMIVNNVAVTQKGQYFEITGDVTNTGITAAKGVVVTTETPATAAGVYPEYALGSLATDDSGSFELTFSINDVTTHLPLVISWKDTTGNDYSVTKSVDLKSITDAGASTTKSTGSTTTGTPSAATGSKSGGMGGASMFGGSASKSSGGVSYLPIIICGVLVIGGIVAYKKRKYILAKIKRQ